MSIIETILKNLSDGQIGESIATYLKSPYKMLYGDLEKVYKAKSIEKALIRAEKKNWLKRIVNQDEVYLSLTPLGKKQLDEYSKKLILNKKNKPWDGKFRIVLFDIPEKNRPIRDELRNRLKEFGFVGWQQSVWVTKQDVTKEFREFIRRNKLQEYILVIETTDLANPMLERLLTK